MNNTDNSLSQIQDVISKGSTGIIVIPMNPTADAIAAATSLYLGLVKAGKNITLGCSSSPQSDLVAADKIQQGFTAGGDNLVISFPYSEGSIDKVDYNIKDNVFNLIIAPRPGFPKIEPQKVKYNYTGGSIDFVITVDAPNLNSLGAIYTENQSQFQSKNIINIDRHLINNNFGTINFVNKTSSSTSELVLKVLQVMQSEIDKDIATNLYAGLMAATNNFTSYSVNADTFNAASALLRAGAVKKMTPRPAGPAGMNVNRPPFQRMSPPQGFGGNGMKNREQQQVGQIETVEQEPTMDETPNNPQDWLKPKLSDGGLI
jgi:hypothetical protein